MEAPPPTPETRPRWRRRCIGLLIVIAGLIVWNGSDRVPADPCRPLVVSNHTYDRQATLPETLRVVSFNIHGGKGLDGRIDLERIATLIAPCDLAGLYEVRNPHYFDHADHAANLAKYTQMIAHFAATERHWWREHFGNALLTKVPVNAAQRLPLPGTRGKAFRNAILAHLPWQGDTLHVVAVHIDREQDRQPQLTQVAALFRSLSAPALLMGDLNSDVRDPVIAALIDDPNIGSPLHDIYGDTLPPKNIDWVFTKGITTVSAELVENDASDHPLVRVVLQKN